MAENLTELAEREAPPEERPPQPRGVFIARFGFAYAALALVTGIAIGGVIVLAGRPSDAGERWSAWRPASDGTARMREIAEFVSQRYRLPSGKPLVGVIPQRPPTVSDLPIRNVALSQGPAEEDLSFVPLSDEDVSYILCGLGQRCAISEGTPSLARARLLHREALELALYTFKYVDGAKSVVALLPPAASAENSQNPQNTFALFFRKRELRSILDRPLQTTLSQPRVLDPTRLGAAETQRIDRLTRRSLFEYAFQQSPDGSAFLVLRPPPL